MTRSSAPLTFVLVALAAGMWAMLWQRNESPRVYVACSGSNHIAIIDPDLHQVIGRIPTDDHPIELLLSPDGRRIFVSNAWANTVQVFDRGTGEFLSRYMTPPKPSAMALSTDGRLLRVAHVEDPRDTILHLAPEPAPAEEPVTVRTPRIERIARTANPFKNIPQTEPAGVAQPRGRDYFLGVSPSIPALLITDTRTREVRGRIALGNEPSEVVLGPEETKAYVAVRANDAVSIVDAERLEVQGQLAVGNGPARMVKAPGGRFLYVVNIDDRTVSVLDMVRDEIRQTLEVGDAPFGAAAWPAEPPKGS